MDSGDGVKVLSWGAMGRGACIAALSLLSLAGCGDDDGGAPVDAGMAVQDAASGDAGPEDAGALPMLPRTIGGDRPARIDFPSRYDGEEPLPLVIVLHGYGASGGLQSLYFLLVNSTTSGGYALITPEGTSNSMDSQFWNAGDACCDFENTGVDDVAYLRGLIEEAKEHANISKVVLIGHSNGGFMAYRMACEAPDVVDGIISLAGATSNAVCEPDESVSIISLHGTADTTIRYEGGSVPAFASRTYPGAEESIERFANHAGCTEAESRGRRDADSDVDGEETEITAYVGCDQRFELWRMNGSDHIPTLTRGLTAELIAGLLAD